MAETDSTGAMREAKAEMELLAALDAVFGPEPPQPEPLRLAKPRPLPPSSVESARGQRYAALGRPHWRTGEWS